MASLQRLIVVLLRVQGHISNNPEVGTLGHILVSLSVPRFLKAYIHGPSLGTDPHHLQRLIQHERVEGLLALCIYILWKLSQAYVNIFLERAWLILACISILEPPAAFTLMIRRKIRRLEEI